MKNAVIVLTCNAEKWLPQFISALDMQSDPPDQVLFIDSNSDDSSVAIIEKSGYPLYCVERTEFNHGGTRRLATELIDADIYIFFTQDALLAAPDSIKELCAAFDDDAVGLAYGRQLPHVDSGLLGAHARIFSYPDQSQTRSMEDAPRLGLKTCFNSDSFAAYRRTALLDVGGFPACVIGTEDAYLAGKMLSANWKVRYVAEACVHHSHDYTLLQTFRRYFDIGVFYGRESWIAQQFGRAGGEGLSFVLSEFKYLLHCGAYRLIPYAAVHSGVKFIAYKLGKFERYLGIGLKEKLSMNPNFWNQDGGKIH